MNTEDQNMFEPDTSEPQVLKEIKIKCLVDGCPWVMEEEFEVREDGESVIDLHLNTHKWDELHDAARNGMLFAFSSDPLQTETAVVYIKAFLEWVRHQNTVVGYGEDGEAAVFIPTGEPNEPSDTEITDLIVGFFETDYRFGN